MVQDPFLGGENMNLNLTPDVNQGSKEARWVQQVFLDLLRAVENRQCAEKKCMRRLVRTYIEILYIL